MKKFAAIFALPGILLLCLTGLAAACLGWRSLDRWCARQLTDADGQTD